MKKCYAVMLFAFLLLLCGCQSQPDETTVISYIKRDPHPALNTYPGLTTDGYNVYFTSAYNGSLTVHKYSPSTNSYSILCTDPLCEHDLTCYPSRLMGLTQLVVSNHHAYFYTNIYTYEDIESGREAEVSFVDYDIFNNSYRLLQSIESNRVKLKSISLFAGNYRYYFDMVNQNEYEDDAENYELTLIQQNLKTGKKNNVYAGAYYSETYYNPLAAVPGKVFFTTPSGTEVRDEETMELLTTLDERLGSTTYDGTYIYNSAWITDSDKSRLYRMNPDTYEIEEFIIPGKISTYWLGDDYIYFITNQKKTTERAHGMHEYPDSTIFKLSKASLDSGTPDIKMLATFDGAFDKTYIEDNALVELDGALYGFYGTFNENVHEFESGIDGFSSTRNGCDFLIRIDCETGEISIVEGTVR